MFLKMDKIALLPHQVVDSALEELPRAAPRVVARRAISEVPSFAFH